MAEDLPERVLRLFDAMQAAYQLIMVHLEQLPLPIRLAEMGEDWDPQIGLDAVERARTVLLEEQPIDPLHRIICSRMILDWQTLYDIGALVMHAGPAPWRLDAMETVLGQITRASELLFDYLSGGEQE